MQHKSSNKHWVCISNTSAVMRLCARLTCAGAFCGARSALTLSSLSDEDLLFSSSSSSFRLAGSSKFCTPRILEAFALATFNRYFFSVGDFRMPINFIIVNGQHYQLVTQQLTTLQIK